MHQQSCKCIRLAPVIGLVPYPFNFSFYVVSYPIKAYKLGMHGPKYVWILVGWYSEDWWMEARNFTDCSPQNILTAAEGYIATGIVYINPRNDVALSGVTPMTFLAEYRERTHNETLFASFMAGQGYDSVWAIAMALNQTLADLKRTSKPTFLQ